MKFEAHDIESVTVTIHTPKGQLMYDITPEYGYSCYGRNNIAAMDMEPGEHVDMIQAIENTLEPFWLRQERDEDNEYGLENGDDE